MFLFSVRKDSSLKGIIYEYKFHTVSIVQHLLLLLTSLQSFDFQLACRIVHALSWDIARCLHLHGWQLYPSKASLHKQLRTLLFLVFIKNKGNEDTKRVWLAGYYYAMPLDYSYAPGICLGSMLWALGCLAFKMVEFMFGIAAVSAVVCINYFILCVNKCLCYYFNNDLIIKNIFLSLS